MTDYSCPSDAQSDLERSVYPGAPWKPYGVSASILQRWTLLYDEPNEAALMGPDSCFSVVRVSLNIGYVTAIDYLTDWDAGDFLDQYGCPPDQIVALYGNRPPNQVHGLANSVEYADGQLSASIADLVLQKNTRAAFLRTLRARADAPLLQRRPALFAKPDDKRTPSWFAFLVICIIAVFVGSTTTFGMGIGVLIVLIVARAIASSRRIPE